MKRFRLLILGLMCALVSFSTQSHAGFGIKDDLKIAYLNSNTTDDGGWGESHGNAAKAVGEAFGVEVAITEDVPEDTFKVKQIIDLYVQRGYNVILGGSFGYSDAFLEAAEQYPDVAFMNCAGITNNQKNLESYYLRTYQGWYLAGMIAGAMTETNKLGMVAAFPIGLVNWDVNAFLRGARLENPSAELAVVYLNTWSDAVKETQASEALLEQGVDVIGTDLSTAAPLIPFEKAGLKSVGFTLDMSSAAPNSQLTAVILQWEHYLIDSLKKIQAGEWEPSEWGAFPGVESGSPSLGATRDSLPQDLLNRVESVRLAMAEGKITPFDGPFNNQAGEQVLPAGQSLDDGALWGMEYLVEGVTGSIPSSE